MGFGQGVLTIMMIIMLIVVISYTILGGMLSVIVTDFMQFVIISIGMLIATIGILTKISFTEISLKVTQNYGSAGFNPFENMHFGWAFIIWMLIASVAMSGLNQPVAAKSFSSESAEVAKKVFFYFGVTLAGRAMIPMFWGVAALTILGPNLNPTTAMPKLLGLIVPSGFLGLLIAGMLAASMSTYSAYLLSWSSVATRDIIEPLLKNQLNEKKSILLTRIIAFFIGIFILFFGLLYEIPATAFQYLAITGTMYASGAFSIIAGGLYWKKANTFGAYTALLMGALIPIAFLALEKFKYLVPENFRFLIDINISGFLSVILPVIGMIVGSLLTQKTHPPISLESLEERSV
jgi:SSS family solute:Na+ symporter